jgi:hypothetical protein
MDEIAILGDAYRQTHQTQAALFELDRTTLAELAEISAGRLFDQIDREVQQTEHSARSSKASMMRGKTLDITLYFFAEIFE